MTPSVSDARLDRYYYIFDSRAHRPVVVDRTTGTEYDWEEEARVQLIRHVEAECGRDVLPVFASWCARQVGAPARAMDADEASPAVRLWRAARRRAEGTASREALRAVREETNDAVLMASTVGLPRRDAEAARLLTVQACLHPDPVEAAANAAHMSERWAEFSGAEEPERAATEMRERQINWLLDRLLTGPAATA